MKDYTLNDFDKEEFILNYEKQDEKIIINYASGRKYQTPYSKELEKYLLHQMKEQILSTDITKIRKTFLKKDTKNSFIWMIISLIILFLDIPMLPTLIIQYTLYSIIVYVPRRTIKKKIKDYEKNKLFIENIEIFKKGINKELEPYYKISKHASQDLTSLIELRNNQSLISKEDSILKEPTINTIEQISLSNLKEIYYLLLLNNELLTHENKLNSKRKTLTKKEK